MKKRLRYNNKSSSRIPAVADASRRHLTARSGLEVMLYELLQHALVQKERRNDLPELTPQRARELYEAYRRGEMADVQLMWDQLEERDETLFTVLHARLGALAEMPWAVNIDADLAEDMQPLAEQQQQLANELLAAVENLPEALTHLGMADFRGVAALEVTGNASRMRWEVIEPWNLCRPVRRGSWYYNAEATSTPTRPEELDPAAVIIREAQPIDLPAMFLICAKYLSVHAWDAFLEVFGIPNIFLEMPPATPQDKALEFDAIVQRLIGEGRGTVPSGAKFHTVETSKDNTQSFEARAKWCNEAIIQLATGGLLTVTAQSGSGTLAGNAHSDSFSRLCAASARSISAAVNRQFLRPALQAAFPHSPMLVSFELAPEPVDDRLQLAQLLGAVNSAGFRPSAETVSELMNFEVQPIQQPPTGANSAPGANTCNQYSHDPGCPDAKADKMPDDADDELREAFADADSMAHSGYTREEIWSATGIDYGPTPNGDSPTAADTIRRARAHERTQLNPRSATARFAHRRAAAHRQALQDAEITNSASTLEQPEKEPPLNDGELAALRALGAELNPAQIAADAEYMAGEMLEGLREPVEKEAITNSAEEHDCEAVKEPCPLQVTSLTGKETREKIKNLAPVEIGYSEEKRTGAQWAEAAKSYFLEHFAGRQMTIGQTDYMLHIPDSVNKAKQATTGVNTQKRTEAFKNLQSVIDNAVHLKSEDAKNKPAQSKKKQALLARTATFETFGYPATINGEKNLIWFNAITKKHGDRDVLFYEFGCTPIDKD